MFTNPYAVSIQLMSPASGDYKLVHNSTGATGCFHSINVPSEWGLGWLILEVILKR
jgi:hypothetical protein